MRRLVFLAVLALLALSCTLPPYDEDVSLAQMTARDLDLVTAVGPFPLWPGEIEDRQVTFFPSPDALVERLFVNENHPLRGFVAVTGDYVVRTVYVDYLVDYYFRADRRVYLDNSDPDRFVYAAQAVKDGTIATPDYFGAAVFFPTGDRWYIGYDQDFVQKGNDLNVALPAIGASFFPADGSYDWLHVLHRVSPGVYSERSWKTNPTAALALESESLIRGGDFALPGLPEAIESAFYSYCPATDRSYLSWYDPARREYRNFWWDSTAVLHVMNHLERRIDRVLSNGWLFSRGENLGYLYDADGQPINQFALGGLSLAYEIYLGGVAHVVFTQDAWAPSGRHEDPKLWFLVYTLPTSELADL